DRIRIALVGEGVEDVGPGEAALAQLGNPRGPAGDAGGRVDPAAAPAALGGTFPGRILHADGSEIGTDEAQRTPCIAPALVGLVAGIDLDADGLGVEVADQVPGALGRGVPGA